MGGTQNDGILGPRGLFSLYSGCLPAYLRETPPALPSICDSCLHPLPWVLGPGIVWVEEGLWPALNILLTPVSSAPGLCPLPSLLFKP